MSSPIVNAGPNYDMQSANNIARIISNYTQILAMLTEMLASGQQTQAQINSLANAAIQSNIPRPKPTYTVDGETYNWTEYQTFICDKLQSLRQLQIYLAGPFEVRSQAF